MILCCTASYFCGYMAGIWLISYYFRFTNAQKNADLYMYTWVGECDPDSPTYKSMTTATEFMFKDFHFNVVKNRPSPKKHKKANTRSKQRGQDLTMQSIEGLDVILGNVCELYNSMKRACYRNTSYKIWLECVFASGLDSLLFYITSIGDGVCSCGSKSFPLICLF